MDVLAHILWTAAGAKGLNAGLKRRATNVAWTAFFGVFPDLFAFGSTFTQMIFSVILGESVFGRPSLGGLPHQLYNYSHSLVIWAAVFLLVWLIRRKPWLPLLGWALHILIDIPSHSISFYPTPFLFPISEYRFPYGVPWSNQWYMIINYSALLLVWSVLLVLWLRRRSARKYLASK